MLGEQDPENSGPTEHGSTTNRLATALTSRYDDAGNGDAFGKLVQQDSQKEENTESAGNQKAAGDRDTIEEGMQREPQQC